MPLLSLINMRLGKKEILAKQVGNRMLGDTLAGKSAEVITFGQKRQPFRILKSQLSEKTGDIQIWPSDISTPGLSCGHWIMVENAEVYDIVSVLNVSKKEKVIGMRLVHSGISKFHDA